MHGWMRSHILQLLGCICEFVMLHACLILWGLKVIDMGGWLGPIAAHCFSDVRDLLPDIYLLVVGGYFEGFIGL